MATHKHLTPTRFFSNEINLNSGKVKTQKKSKNILCTNRKLINNFDLEFMKKKKLHTGKYF